LKTACRPTPTRWKKRCATASWCRRRRSRYRSSSSASGIRYDDLSDEEKEQWDAIEWDEDGIVPSEVEAEAVNKWLFNTDTVDKVLAHLMTRGVSVAGGDRLGKTILFAKNQAHAEFIAERFNANYPHFKGEFARVITFKTEYAQSLIDTSASRSGRRTSRSPSTCSTPASTCPKS
jgi:type I site-specific restriction endonuclease